MDFTSEHVFNGPQESTWLLGQRCLLSFDGKLLSILKKDDRTEEVVYSQGAINQVQNTKH